jgi:hypothetical protein
MKNVIFYDFQFKERRGKLILLSLLPTKEIKGMENERE